MMDSHHFLSDKTVVYTSFAGSTNTLVVENRCNLSGLVCGVCRLAGERTK